MSSPKNWAKYHATQSAIEREAAERSSLPFIAQLGSEFANHDDINWLEHLLTYDLIDRHRFLVEGSIAWLKAVPRRTLGDHRTKSNWRGLYQRIESMIKQGFYKEWSEREYTEEQRHASQRRRVCRAVRTAESKPTPPDWMSDHSKLPMKPPGR